MFKRIQPPDLAGIAGIEAIGPGMLNVQTLPLEEVVANTARGLMTMLRAVLPHAGRDGVGFVDSAGTPRRSIVLDANTDEADGTAWILAAVVALATSCQLRGTPDTDRVKHTMMAHHKLAGMIVRAALTGFPDDTNMLVVDQGASDDEIRSSVLGLREIMASAVGANTADKTHLFAALGLEIQLLFDAQTVTGITSDTEIFMWLSMHVKRIGNETQKVIDAAAVAADEEEEEETKEGGPAFVDPHGFIPLVFFVASDGAILLFIVDPRPGAVQGGWVLDWGTTDVTPDIERDEDGKPVKILPAGSFHIFKEDAPAYVLPDLADLGPPSDNTRVARWITRTTRTLSAILRDHMANDPDVLRTGDYDPARLNPGGMPLFGMSDFYYVSFDNTVLQDFVAEERVIGDISDPWEAPGLPPIGAAAPLPRQDDEAEERRTRLNVAKALMHRTSTRTTTTPTGAVRFPDFEVPAFYMRYLFSARYGYTGRCQMKQDVGPFGDDNPWRTLPDVVAATSAASHTTGPSRSKRVYESVPSHRVFVPPINNLSGVDTRPDGPPALLGPQPMYPPELEMTPLRWRTNRFFQFGRIVLGSAVRRAGDAVADGLYSFPYRNWATGIALYIVNQLRGAVTPWTMASFDVPLADWDDAPPHHTWGLWRNKRHWEDAVTFLRKFMTVHASQEVGMPLLAAASSDAGAFANPGYRRPLPAGVRRGNAPLRARSFFGPAQPSPDVTSTAKQEWHAGFSDACRATLGQSGVNDFTTLTNAISVIMATYLTSQRVEGAVNTLVQSVSIVRRAFEATARAVGIRPFGFSVVDRRVVMNESAPGADPDASYLTRDAMAEVVVDPETGRKSRRRLRVLNFEEHDEDRPLVPESTELQEDERAIAAFIVAAAIRIHKRDAVIREEERKLRRRMALFSVKTYGKNDDDEYFVDAIPAVLDASTAAATATAAIGGDNVFADTGTPAFDAEVREKQVVDGMSYFATMRRVQGEALRNVWPSSTGGVPDPVPEVARPGGREGFARMAVLTRNSTKTPAVTLDTLATLWSRCDTARAEAHADLVDHHAGSPQRPVTYSNARVAAQNAVRTTWQTHPLCEGEKSSLNDARSLSFFFTLPESIAVGTISYEHIIIHDVAMATEHTFDVDDVVSGSGGVGRTIASLVDLTRALRVKTFHIDPMAVGPAVGVPGALAWPSYSTDMDTFEADMEEELLKASRYIRGNVKMGATRRRVRFLAADFATKVEITAAQLGVSELDTDEDGFLSNETQIRAFLMRHDVVAAAAGGAYEPLQPSLLTEEGKWAVLCGVLLPDELDPVPHVSDTLVAARQEDDPGITRAQIAGEERAAQVLEYGDSVLRIAVAHMILRLRCAQRDPMWANITFQDSCRAMPHNLTDEGELDTFIPATNFHDVQEGAFTAPATLVVGMNRSASAKGTIMNNDDLAVRGSLYALRRHITEEMRAAAATLKRDLTGAGGDGARAVVAFPTGLDFNVEGVKAVEKVRYHSVFDDTDDRLPDIPDAAVMHAGLQHPCTDPWFYDLCAFDGEDPETGQSPSDYLTKTFKADGALVSAHIHTPLGYLNENRATTRKALNKAVERAASIGSQRNPSDAGSSVKAVFTALVHEVATATAATQTQLLERAATRGLAPPIIPNTGGAAVADVDPENVSAGLVLRPTHSELIISITVGKFRTFVRPPATESVRAADMDIPLYDVVDHVAAGAGAGADPNRLGSLVGRLSISYSPTLHAIAAGVIAQRWSPINMITRQRLPLSVFLRTGDLPAAPILAFAANIYLQPQRSASGEPTEVYLAPPKPWSGELASVWGPACRMNKLVLDPAPHRMLVETVAMLQSDDTYRLKPADKGDATSLSAGICRTYLRLRAHVEPGSHTATPWKVLTTRRVLVPSPSSDVWIETLAAAAREANIVFPVAVAAYIMTEFLHAFAFIPQLHDTIAALPASTSKPHVIDGVVFGVGSGTRAQFALIPFALFSPRFIVVTPASHDVVPVLQRLVVFVAALVRSCDKPIRMLALRTLHMLISVLTTNTQAYGISGAPLLFGPIINPAILADRAGLMKKFSAIGAEPGIPKVEVAVGLGDQLTLHPRALEHERNVCCLSPHGIGKLSILRAQAWDPDAPDASKRVTTWDHKKGAAALPGSITARWAFVSHDGMETHENLTGWGRSTDALVRKPGHYLLEVTFESPTTGVVATSVCGPWEVIMSTSNGNPTSKR